MVFVNILAIEDEFEINSYFRLSKSLVFGIAFSIFGAFLFFTKPNDNNHQCTLRRQHPSMGPVVGTITIPLIVAEVHYQKFESLRSCDTFIPAVYRKCTKHARWDQVSKTKWRIHQGDVSG